MVAVIWGTKVRHREAGTTAIYCATCDGTRYADVLSVEQAQHIYYISGSYSEVGKYVRCRLCGSCYELPEGANAGFDVPEDDVEPEEQFLQKHHPALLNADNIERHEAELPKGVTREQFALFQSINMTAEAIRGGSNVNQNAGTLVVIALMVWAFGGIAGWAASDRNVPMQIVGVAVATVVAWSLIVLAILWTRRLVIRGIDETLSPCVARFVSFTGTNLRELTDLSARPEVCGWWGRRYLLWFSKRERK